MDKIREDRYLGNYYGYHDGYDGSVFGTDGVAKTIVARTGGVACILDIKYLGNLIYESAQAGKVYDDDGLCPALGTMQGGMRQPMTVNVRQATKEGSIPCQVGGGSRSELSRFQNKKRQSTGRRTDMPDTDNGEYP